MLYVAIFLVPLILMFLFATIKMVPQYERGVVFRLGKVKVPKGPGVVVVVPILERILRVDLRTITHDVPGQDIITKDNVSVRVSAVVYFRVIDPVKASIEV
jgi:regulator of protease activity HflC (stomatin/prohibitin superfamily)